MNSRVARAFGIAAIAAAAVCWATKDTSAWTACRVDWSYDGYTLYALGELDEVWGEDHVQYFAVDWGDGSSDYGESNRLSGNAYLAQSHTYSDIGTYTVHFQIGDQSGVCLDFAQAVFIPNQ
jgi:hypothetical protein